MIITYLKQNIVAFSAAVVVALVYSVTGFCDDDKDVSLDRIEAAIKAASKFCDDDKDASLIQKVPAADESDEDIPLPDKAGERMEVEIEGVKVAFRWCPPGKFTRHWDVSTKEDWDGTIWDDDKGAFTITLTKGFWLAETETTQELWFAVTGGNPSEGVRKKMFR